MFLEKEKEKNWQYYSKISENEYPDYLKKIYKYKMGKKLNLEKSNSLEKLMRSLW